VPNGYREEPKGYRRRDELIRRKRSLIVGCSAPSDEAARLLRKVVAGVDPNQGVFFTQSF
jgi:hypothetical protein